MWVLLYIAVDETSSTVEDHIRECVYGCLFLGILFGICPLLL